MKLILPLVIILIAWGCSPQPVKNEETPDLVYDDSMSLPHPDWVEKRVENARDRLQASEAGQIVWKAIESHGGLKSWYDNGPLYFRFNYRPLNPGNKIRDTYQTVDTWSAVARHQLAADQSIEYGWDGEDAWKYPADAELAINPRFWSLSPYYFVGLPFVLSDDGIILSKQENLEYEGADHFIVKASFGDDVGDASDYYILYINSETYRLAAIRYIVSFKGFYPDGGFSPEKLMTYEGAQEISGIIFPEKHRTFTWSDAGRGEHVTDITVTDVAFKPNTSKSYFTIPEGSYVMKTLME